MSNKVYYRLPAVLGGFIYPGTYLGGQVTFNVPGPDAVEFTLPESILQKMKPLIPPEPGLGAYEVQGGSFDGHLVTHVNPRERLFHGPWYVVDGARKDGRLARHITWDLAWSIIGEHEVKLIPLIPDPAFANPVELPFSGKGIEVAVDSEKGVVAVSMGTSYRQWTAHTARRNAYALLAAAVQVESQYLDPDKS